MNEHAVVLMSTYNGCQYLNEQLQCIFDQTYPGTITVLIRDDGSKDNTVALAQAFPQRENRKIQVVAAENVRPQRSFLALIRMAPKADWYFFADQDDVWDLDKIEKSINGMRAFLEVPATCCSNYRLSDMDLNVYDGAAIKATPVFTPLQILFYNKIPGCCMGFNYALMEKLQQLTVKNVMMHDSMALALAALTGKVIYEEAPLITHRIHRDNVVGDGHKKIVLHKWIPEKFRLLTKKEDYDLSELAEDFLRVGGAEMCSEYRRDMELLRDFKKSWGSTCKLLQHPDSKGRLLDRTVMSIRCKILFHIF